MVNPARYTFKVWRGATFRKVLELLDENDQPKDLTGYTGIMSVRQSINANVDLLTLTNGNGGITFGGTDGTIELFIDDSVTDTLTFPTAYFDLKITAPSTDTDIILFGSVTVQG
jgi:hypothetical protein